MAQTSAARRRPPPEPLTLPGALRRAREAAGLSQSALATASGREQAAVARSEREGHEPAVETLRRTAEATGTRITVVFEPDGTLASFVEV